MNPMLALLGWWEITAIFVIVLILFSSTRLPDVLRGLRQGIGEFGWMIGKLTPDDEKESGLVYEALTHDNRTAEFVYRHKLDFGPISAMILFIAQGFGAGRLPYAPGTFGSLVGLVLFALLIWPGNFWIYLAGTIAGILSSVWICGAAEKLLKQTDPPSVVLDEIVALPLCFVAWVANSFLSTGQMPALASFFNHGAWLGTLGVFAAFRVFDVAKPWPVQQSQKLPGGLGVTMDDLVAALYVNVVTFVAINFPAIANKTVSGPSP